MQQKRNEFAKKLKLHIYNLTFPYLFIMTKFHKNPIKFRFVTCATNSYSFYADKKKFQFIK